MFSCTESRAERRKSVGFQTDVSHPRYKNVTIAVTAALSLFVSSCPREKGHHGTQEDGSDEGSTVIQTVVMPVQLLTEVDKGLIQPSVFLIKNLKLQSMTLELLDKNCSCQILDLPDHLVPTKAAAEIQMLIDPPRKAEKKAYWATVELAWGPVKQRLKLRAELDVMSELLTVPTEASHDFASEDLARQALSVRQRVRSDAEPDTLRPEFAELPEEVELLELDHVGTRRIWESGVGNGESGEGSRELAVGSSQDEQQGFVSRSEHSTIGDQRAPIWEIEWRATFRLKATERVRQSPDGFVGQFLVMCGEGEFQRVQVPIRLRCVEAIQASPAHTYFGSIKQGEERRRTVLLRARDDQEFEISEMVCESPAFTTQFQGQGPKKLHVVQVVFAGSRSGSYEGKVHVTTSHPNCPKLSFSVEGSVAAIQAKGEERTAEIAEAR